ncbi:MAG: hypothetical protein RLZZ540_2594 [Bacteroidota bacterium]|jgi:plasmid stabilization system protein ParE
MAKKSVVWTETAIKQRREILKYWTIRNKSTTYAEKLIGLINERIKLISQNPEAGQTDKSFRYSRSSNGEF